MRLIAYIAFGLLASEPCDSRTMPEDSSVVSVYLKNPAVEDNSQSSLVYLITSGLTKTITSPITSLFGLGKNVTTSRPFHRIEIADETAHTAKPDINPVDNEIPKGRDVEELTNEGAVKKEVKKPEKITLFSSYLPDDEMLKLNSTGIKHLDIEGELPVNIDNIADEDYDDTAEPRDGPVVFVLEVIASLFELVWSGLAAMFTSSSHSQNTR